jgi:diguanylate cyclase (GGDEF)-like protein/PAS domain S-box-containing protein
MNLPASRRSPCVTDPLRARRSSRSAAETLRLLEALQSNAPVGFGFVDRDLRIVRLNETLAAVTELTAADHLGQTVSAALPLLWPRLEPLFRRVLEAGQAVLDVEIGGGSADPARRRYWLTSFFPVSSEDEIIGIGVVVLDITKRKHAEEAAHFQAELLDAVGQAVVATDQRGLVVYWNGAAEQMYGWTASDAIGRKVRDLISSGETPDLTASISAVLLRGQSWSGDFQVTRIDGTRFPVYSTATPVLGPDGSLVAVIAVSMDVAEREAGEQARRQLAAIVEGTGDAIFGATTDGTVTSWNAAAEGLFGYTADEIIGQSVELLAPAGKAMEQAQMRVRLSAGGPHERLETTRRCKDGRLVEVLITASTATDKSNNVVGLSVIAHDITVRRVAQRALEASQHRLGVAQRIAHLGSFELDIISQAMTWSDELHRILGLDETIEPSSDLFASMVHPDDLPVLSQAWLGAIEQRSAFDLIYRVVRPDGSQRWVRGRAVPELAEDGAVVTMVGTVMDDTERIEADRVCRAAEARFEIGFEQAGIGTAIVGLDGVPQRVNLAVCALLGRPADLLVGRRWTEYAHPDEVPLLTIIETRVAAGCDTYADERRYLRPGGAIVWASCNVTLVRDDSGEPQYFVAQLQDITDRKHMEEEAAHQALHDSLTGLANRLLLADRVAHGLAGAHRRGSPLGMIFVDLDHFKMVNESFGYSCGDDLLRYVAQRMVAAIRPSDTVARFGGDEFVIVCDDVTAVEAEEIAGRVLRALSQPFRVGDRTTMVTASLGVVIADHDATAESLLRDSGLAMYRAKERGRCRVELFDDVLRSKADRRRSTASALNCALEREEFRILYQPVVDLSTGAMISAEALLRWQHPDRGLVGPDEFIPLAEETGLIVPLGTWVFEQACRQLLEWQCMSPTMSVAVNVSVRQMLAPDIAARFGEIIKRTGVRPESLYLELTESMFMEDVEYFGRTLADLKSLGVRLSIDDFGTGFSSLSYLKRYPLDAVKVDRAFVDGLGTDPHDTALVTAIIAMANALGLEVTAEGVETRDQLGNLKKLGCPRAQGFYLARPAPSATVTQLLARSNRWNLD